MANRAVACARRNGHSHLAYVLELPPELGDAQRAMRIEREASYVVAVRNPDGAAREPGRELGLELDPQVEQVHDADLFRELRIRPGDLPLEPMRSGKLR